MKILQSSASSQTLKIIPRSYPELVDVVIKNEDTKDVTTLSDVTTVSNLGYLEIPSVFTLVEDTFYSFEVWDKVNVDGVKFISANNEYISSPDQSYFGADITGLDIEIRYNDFSNANPYFVSQNNLSPSGDDSILISINSLEFGGSDNVMAVKIADNLIMYSFSEYPPTSGTIKINSDGVNINVLLDDVNLITQAVNDTNLSNLTGSLIFGGWTFGDVFGGGYDGTISYIKLNNHIWTFSEGTGSTTTNSESVVSTLNSDVSTELMWSNEQNEIIYKGKIFCTNQETYSINNGEYTTRSRNNKYIVYGQ